MSILFLKTLDLFIFRVYNNTRDRKLILEWDENKRAENIRKHKLDFALSRFVLTDSLSAIYEDTRKNYGEKRYLAYGLYKNRVLCVCYVLRGNAHRIISLRNTHKKERRKYYANN